MRFAVVIPTYNRAPTVARAIESVLAQTYSTFDLVVVDDGSDDDTAAVVGAFGDSRIRYVHQVNQGVCAARNRGANESDAPWLAFLDSDDVARPGWLAAFADPLVAGAELVSSGAQFHEADGTQREERPSPQGPAFGGVTALYLAGCFALTRTAFERVGGYAAGLKFSENTDLGLRLGTLALEGQLRALAVNSIGVDLIRRPPQLDPAVRFDSAMYLLTHRRRELARDRDQLAAYWAIAGSSARRLRRRPTALRCHLRELRVRPSVRGVARLARALTR